MVMATVMSKEQWFRPHEAAALVRQHRGGSIGRSEELVRAAIASGEVRTIEKGVQDFSLRPGPITKKILFSNKDDLVDWLSRQAPATPAAIPTSSPRKKKTAVKTARIQKAVLAIYGVAGPPDHLSPKLICRDVNNWFEKQGQKRDITSRHIGRVTRKKNNKHNER